MPEQVGLLVVEQVEREPLAEARQQPPRVHGVGLADVEHVEADDAHDALAQIGRVAQPLQRAVGELGADVGVVAVARPRVEVQAAVPSAPADARLAEIVEQRRQPHAQRHGVVGRRLDDRERVLVDGEVVIAALLVVADRRLELRKQRDEHAGVAGKAERPARLAAEQQLRELPHPVRGEATADPLARDELHRRGLLVHLAQRLLVGLEAELRDEPQRPHEPQRILREAPLRDRAQHPPLDVSAAVERVDERAVGQPPGDRR